MRGFDAAGVKSEEAQASADASVPPAELARGAALRSALTRQGQRTVLVYALGAGLWIAVSDRVLGALVRDPELLVRTSLYKGVAFVAATAGLLHLLLRRNNRIAERTIAALEQTERERQEHEAERKRVAAIVEATGEAVVFTGSNGTIVSFSAGAERMLGYAAADVVGRSTTIFAPANEVAQELEDLTRARSGEHVREGATRVRSDGTKVLVAIRYTPVFAPQEAERRERQFLGVSQTWTDSLERQSATAMAENERRFARDLVESMPGIFYLYDESGHFLRWNRNFERVSGYRRQEIAAMHPLDFFKGEDKELVAQRIAEVFAKGYASVEASFVAKDGTSAPYFLTGKRLLFEGKSCLLGVGLDITERKRAEQALIKSEERYRSTLESTIEGCQIFDFEWRYLYLNEAASRQNRRPSAELLGKRLPDVWPGIEATEIFALLKRSMDDRVALSQEVEVTFADGLHGWFDVRVQPVPEGIFVLSIEISERKRAERALRELNEGLELKVLERTRELETARKRAEGADRLKSAFLATMSHELRTPLNSILGFTGIVLQQLPGPLNSEQEEQLGIVQSSARHLLDLINDIIDISRIEAGQLEVRDASFAVAPAFERVAASVRPAAEHKGLELHLQLPTAAVVMNSDRLRVEQIALNLLNNAIKFTDAGSVSLCVDLTVPSAGGATPSLRIRVEDTGIGIKEQDLPHLFLPFRQLDTGTREQREGTGLGLAICRRLTELLGGNISVESTWGKGSVFTVLLPLGADR